MHTKTSHMPRLLSTLRFAMALYAQGLSVNGNWAGTLHAGAASLRCNVHLDGSGGTWESVDQAATLPAKSVMASGRAVHVDIGIAKFEGTLTEAGDAIEGTFEQGPAKLPLTLKRVTGNFAKAARPQEAGAALSVSGRGSYRSHRRRLGVGGHVDQAENRRPVSGGTID